MNGILKIDAKNTDIVYTATCTVNTKKEFVCKGGRTHQLTLVVSDNRGNSTNVRSFMFLNCDGFFTYSEATQANGGKPKIGFSRSKNPGLVNCFAAIQEAISRECSKNNLFPLKSFLASASTVTGSDGSTREYDDTLFVTLKMDDNSSGCTTALYVLNNGEILPILGNELIPEGEETITIRTYVKESGFDESFVKFIAGLYNCKINIVKPIGNGDKKVVISDLNVKNMPTRRMLINKSEFNSVVKDYIPNFLNVKIKSFYLCDKDEKTYCTLLSTKCNTTPKVNFLEEEDDEWEAMMNKAKAASLSNKPQIIECDPEEVNPDDFM